MLAKPNTTCKKISNCWIKPIRHQQHSFFYVKIQGNTIKSYCEHLVMSPRHLHVFTLNAPLIGAEGGDSCEKRESRDPTGAKRRGGSAIARRKAPPVAEINNTFSITFTPFNPSQSH